jgi:hypothetical protein
VNSKQLAKDNTEMKTDHQVRASQVMGGDHRSKLERIYDRLIEIAHAGKTITIDELARIYYPDFPFPQNRTEVTRALCEISCQENAAGRPLLSAVVVLPEIPYPTRDFFFLARELGLNMYNDERSFYGHELKRVHAYWRDRIPLKQAMYFLTFRDEEVNVTG